jgi:hypothetical protein
MSSFLRRLQTRSIRDHKTVKKQRTFTGGILKNLNYNKLKDPIRKISII